MVRGQPQRNKADERAEVYEGGLAVFWGVSDEMRHFYLFIGLAT